MRGVPHDLKTADDGRASTASRLAGRPDLVELGRAAARALRAEAGLPTPVQDLGAIRALADLMTPT